MPLPHMLVKTGIFRTPLADMVLLAQLAEQYSRKLVNTNVDRVKLGQSDLLYWSKSLAEKLGVNRHFQAS